MTKQLLVRIPDNLHREVKSKVALEGRSIQEVVSELLKEYLLDIPVKGCVSWDDSQLGYAPDIASRNG